MTIAQNSVRSEGEIFLGEFFRSMNVKYLEQVQIDNLKGDVKSYRLADFYLPKFKVYVEFLGKWNASESAKESYRIKRDVYKKNNIPCIYIYPENLGIIEYIYFSRLRQVLKEYALLKELRKFNIEMLVDEKGGDLLGFFLSIILLVLFQFDKEAELFWQSCAVVGVFALYKAIKIYMGYRKFFVKESNFVSKG